MVLSSDGLRIKSFLLVSLVSLVVTGCAGAATAADPAANEAVVLTGSQESSSLPMVTDVVDLSTPKAGETVDVAFADFEIYNDIDFLVRSSSVVVVGKTGEASRLSPSDADVNEAGMYEVPFQVQRVLRITAGPDPQGSIRLVQQGGLGEDGVTRKVGGSPIYQADQCYLLFLRYYEPTGRYVAVGGEQGTYTCDDKGILAAIPNSSTQGKVLTLLSGATIDEIAEKVK